MRQRKNADREMQPKTFPSRPKRRARGGSWSNYSEDCSTTKGECPADSGPRDAELSNDGLSGATRFGFWGGCSLGSKIEKWRMAALDVKNSLKPNHFGQFNLERAAH